MNVRHFLSAASAGKKSCFTSKVHQDPKIIGMYYCANNMKNQRDVSANQRVKVNKILKADCNKESLQKKFVYVGSYNIYTKYRCSWKNVLIENILVSLCSIINKKYWCLENKVLI